MSDVDAPDEDGTAVLADPNWSVAVASVPVALDADGTMVRSLVLLGANAAPGMTDGLNGISPDPLNPPCAFSTVIDRSHALLKTIKKSFFSSFLPAVSLVNKRISSRHAGAFRHASRP